MKLSTWRPRLLKFLADNLEYDHLLTDVPHQIESSGIFAPPLRGLTSQYMSTGIKATAIQDIHYAKRFGSMSYWALPIAELEGMHQSFTVRFLEGFRNKDRGITVVNADSGNRLVENPIYIADPNQSDDWTVELYWCFTVEYMAEDETPLPLFTPQELTIDLHRAKLLDFTDTILDTRIKVEDLTL